MTFHIDPIVTFPSLELHRLVGSFVEHQMMKRGVMPIDDNHRLTTVEILLLLLLMMLRMNLLYDVLDLL